MIKIHEKEAQKGSFLYRNGSILYKKEKFALKGIKTEICLQKIWINHFISAENKKRRRFAAFLRQLKLNNLILFDYISTTYCKIATCHSIHPIAQLKMKFGKADKICPILTVEVVFSLPEMVTHSRVNYGTVNRGHIFRKNNFFTIEIVNRLGIY